MRNKIIFNPFKTFFRLLSVAIENWNKVDSVSFPAFMRTIDDVIKNIVEDLSVVR